MAQADNREIFEEGASAYEQGLGKTRCPYPKTSEAYRCWLKGWERRELIDAIVFDQYQEPTEGATARSSKAA